MSGKVVWQWDNQDPYGNNAPNENPSSQGTFHFNLRFPGQYYDTETNLAYNVNRDYDASIGRYVESDPIGLYAGVNTYGYVGGNPLKWADPQGLDVILGIDFGRTLPTMQDKDLQYPSDPNRVKCFIKKYGLQREAQNARGDRKKDPNLVYDLSLRDAEHYLLSYEEPINGMLAIGYTPAKMLGFDSSQASAPTWSEIEWGLRGFFDNTVDTVLGLNTGMQHWQRPVDPNLDCGCGRH